MAYICECGNTEEFLEVFDTAVDIVDGSAKFVRTEARNVSYYECGNCERTIPYTVFFPKAVSSSSPPAN